jgi:hypothetical protein
VAGLCSMSLASKQGGRVAYCDGSSLLAELGSDHRFVAAALAVLDA